MSDAGDLLRVSGGLGDSEVLVWSADYPGGAWAGSRALDSSNGAA